MPPSKNEGVNITIREILRYLYGALLLFLVVYFINPDFILQFRKTLGSVLSPLILLALGAVIYSVYKPISEILFCQIPKWIHKKFLNKNKCLIHWLEEIFGVSSTNTENAYRIIRDRIMFDKDEDKDRNIKERLHMQHSEIHILYITFFILIGCSLFLFIKQIISLGKVSFSNYYSVLFPLGVSFLVFAVFADILLCEQIFSYLKTSDLNLQEIRELLEKAELVDRKSEKKTNITFLELIFRVILISILFRLIYFIASIVLKLVGFHLSF